MFEDDARKLHSHAPLRSLQPRDEKLPKKGFPMTKITTTSSLFTFAFASLTLVGCSDGVPLEEAGYGGAVTESSSETASSGENAEGESVTEKSHAALSSSTLLTSVGVSFHTGGDDKRDDSRVWLTVRLKSGVQLTEEIFRGERLPDWTRSNRKKIALPANTKNGDIHSVIVRWQQGGGGLNGDNWNLQGLEIEGQIGSGPRVGTWNIHQSISGYPLKRFTGSVTSHTVAWKL